MNDSRYIDSVSQKSLQEAQTLEYLYRPENKANSLQQIYKYLDKYSIIHDFKKTRSKINMKNLVDKSSVKAYKRGDIIFEKQQSFRTFNILLCGSVTLYYLDQQNTHPEVLDTEGRPLTFLKRIKHPQYFGHNLELNQKQIYYVRAEELTYTLQMRIPTIYKLFQGILVFNDLLQKYAVFKRIPMFKELSKKQVLRIIDDQNTQKKFFTRDSIVYREGSEPQFLFFILLGQFSLYKSKQQSKILIATLGSFQVLGMQEILNKTPYNFTLKCSAVKGALIRISKKLILDIFERAPLNWSFIRFRHNERISRLSTIQNINQRIKSSKEEHQINMKKLSFSEKFAFHSESQVKPNKTLYITNKKTKRFETQQSFYGEKLQKIATIVQQKQSQRHFSSVDFGNNGFIETKEKILDLQPKKLKNLKDMIRKESIKYKEKNNAKIKEKLHLKIHQLAEVHRKLNRLTHSVDIV